MKFLRTALLSTILVTSLVSNNVYAAAANPAADIQQLYAIQNDAIMSIGEKVAQIRYFAQIRNLAHIEERLNRVINTWQQEGTNQTDKHRQLTLIIGTMITDLNPIIEEVHAANNEHEGNLHAVIDRDLHNVALKVFGGIIILYVSASTWQKISDPFTTLNDCVDALKHPYFRLGFHCLDQQILYRSSEPIEGCIANILLKCHAHLAKFPPLPPDQVFLKWLEFLGEKLQDVLTTFSDVAQYSYIPIMAMLVVFAVVSNIRR